MCSDKPLVSLSSADRLPDFIGPPHPPPFTLPVKRGCRGQNAGVREGRWGLGLPDICPPLTADSRLKAGSAAHCPEPLTPHTRETARPLNLAGGGAREVSVSRVRAGGGSRKKETVDKWGSEKEKSERGDAFK